MLPRYRIVFEYGVRITDGTSYFNDLSQAREVFAARVAEVKAHYAKRSENAGRAITLWRGDLVMDEWRYGDSP